MVALLVDTICHCVVVSTCCYFAFNGLRSGLILSRVLNTMLNNRC